jgi:hypothetical protein
VDDEDQIVKFVRDFHAPLAPLLKFSIDVAKNLSCGDSRLASCGVFVWKLLAYQIRFGLVMKNIEKVAWHLKGIYERVYGST